MPSPLEGASSNGDTPKKKAEGAAVAGGAQPPAAAKPSSKARPEGKGGKSPAPNAAAAKAGASREAVSRFGSAGKDRAVAKVRVSREAVSRFGAVGKGGSAKASGESAEQAPAAAAGPDVAVAEPAVGLDRAKPRGRSYKKSDLGGTTASGLKGLLDKGRAVEDVFKSLDADDSGLLDEEELVQGMKDLGTILEDDDLKELKAMLGLPKGKKMELNLEQFKKVVDQTPAANSGGTETGAWIIQLHLDEVLIPLFDEYEFLPEPDDTFSAQDKLAHVRGLELEDVQGIVAKASEIMTERLMKGIQQLKDVHAERMAAGKEVLQGNSKFSGDGGGGQITMVYGKLDDFHKGLETMIGLPNPRVFEGMEADHCSRADSEDGFTAWNYGIHTTPSIEWEYVVRPDPDKKYDGEASEENSHGRTRQSVEELLAKDKIKKAKLSKEELIALRLYTGPMFVKYNCILRGFPKAVIDGLKGNRYVTTLHAIVSGINKLR
jgi:hypothetical protein